MNLKKGNLVKVLTGKDKNKSGEIIEVINRLSKAKVKGINIVKKHVKTTKEKKGGIFPKESFIHISNLKLIDEKAANQKEAQTQSYLNQKT
jgi:large subunit ribosomal protein L24